MNTTNRWDCGQCGTGHNTEEYAKECCAPDVYEVFICGKCGQDYDYRPEANECCKEVQSEPTEDA